MRNTGPVSGYTVPQLYVGFPDFAPEGTPARVLRGFDKLKLDPGNQSEVSFSLTRRDFSYWDTGKQDGVIPSGAFTFSVGFQLE